LTTVSRLPYPGLRSFRREESDLFFGREDCINTMVDRLATTRFLAVLGASGTGKSSVVKTGLLDALDLGLMSAAGSSWRVVDFRPGGAPLRSLARRLLETEAGGPETSGNVSETDVALLRAFLVRGPRAVAEWCREGHLPEQANLLLLVDQFEELFRYQDYAGREEAEAVAAMLIECARQRRSSIYVVLTMRSEYLGGCALIEGLAEAISAGMFLIPRMSREQCRAAIVGPATVCGFAIDDALVGRLLNDLAAFAPWDDRGTRDQLARLGRRADQLPLLQYCLNRMWVSARGGAPGLPIRLTLSDYERIGGLGGALNAHADEILRGLGDHRRPVAEAVFQALTEGSTVAEAVRRPTSLRELVGICDGDEAGVGAVVDAFRAPGCNFLTPELNPANPKTLEASTIVDISHESLIRQWKQLSEWLEAEARAVRQWRRLLDRFEDGQPMIGVELANIIAWRDEHKPSAAWARRYGGDFIAINTFIENSERQQRRFAPAILPLFGLAVFAVSGIFGVGLIILLFDLASAGDVLAHALFSETIAITCAFGLWRYSGLGLRRALLAGATLFVVGFAGGFGSVSILKSQGLAFDPAENWWNVTLAAPCFVTVMAIFEPSFRRLPVWMVLVATYVIGQSVAAPAYVNSTMHFLLQLAAWSVWYAVIGAQLRRSSDPVEDARRRQRLPALKSASLAVAIFFVIAIWSGALMAALYRSTPEPSRWPGNIAVYSVALAIALGFGLRYDRGLGGASALRAAVTIFAVEFGTGGALMALLLWRNVPLLQAYHWVGVFLIAPGAMACLAIFDRAFRPVSVWLPLAAIYVVPYASFVLLYDLGLIRTNELVLNLLIVMIALLWVFAIGYWTRRLPAATALSLPEAPRSAAVAEPSRALP
jgi:hypothetical protein